MALANPFFSLLVILKTGFHKRTLAKNTNKVFLVLSLKLKMQYQLKTYRGIEKGWLPVGRPKNRQEAYGLLKWVEMHQANYSHKVDQIPLRLFPLGNW